jgi:hypothetical protein
MVSHYADTGSHLGMFVGGVYILGFPKVVLIVLLDRPG